MTTPRPIGGFFELELPPAPRALPGVAFASGRAGLTALLRAARPRRVLVPFYTCDALLEPLQHEGIPFSFYALDEELAPPRDLDPGPGGLAIVVDYLGCQGGMLRRIEEDLGPRLIIDATQSFFREPPGQARLFNSARKFFGVPDGGFVHGPAIEPQPPHPEPPYVHLVERFLGHQAAAYGLFQQAERAVSGEPAAMSELSRRLLGLVDMAAVAAQRRRNFAVYQAALGERALLVPGEGDVPFFFPLLWPDEDPPRAELARQQIFTPRFWADVEQRAGSGFDLERRVSRRLLPLPIDQRYNEADCARVVAAVRTLLERAAGSGCPPGAARGRGGGAPMPLSAPCTFSVCVITYNQAPFIRQALAGVLKQEANFPFDLIVADDGSTDGTREIVREIVAAHPGKIRFFDRERNIGPTANFLELIDAAAGRYIAYCDGDDYWTDPHKLQKQADFLDANPDHAGCFSRADIVNKEGDLIARYEQVYTYDPRPSFDEDYILRRGVGSPMCTIAFRGGLWPRLPPWFRRIPTHAALMLTISRFGLWGFQDEVMAHYRVHEQGIFSLRSPLTKLLSMAEMARAVSVDEHFAAHDRLVGKHLADLSFQIAREAYLEARASGSVAVFRKVGESLLWSPPYEARYYQRLAAGVARRSSDLARVLLSGQGLGRLRRQAGPVVRQAPGEAPRS